nr:undecaprenyldiphospho-muramoylpentapeptide beta-N-acetylglucosaminyltransferase [Spirulina major]
MIAASGTGGHLFPALAVAEQLSDWQIDWLGATGRLEQALVKNYPLHTVNVEGFQSRGLKSLLVFYRLAIAIFQVRKLLKQLHIDAVFTTGGYISAPAILAARWCGIPVIIHESNAIPGKVTQLLAPFCTQVAIGLEMAAQSLPKKKTIWLGTPVRKTFLSPQSLDFPIPQDAILIVVMGGSQGAIALNQLVRDCGRKWLDAGAYLVHLTGDRDPESFHHSHYFPLPFYHNMAGLLQRANLAISRSGAGTLTELAITKTPAILIPYPFAAEDHQYYNALAFKEAGAALIYRQQELTPEILEKEVLRLLNNPDELERMSENAGTLAVADSAERLAALIQDNVKNRY